MPNDNIVVLLVVVTIALAYSSIVFVHRGQSKPGLKGLFLDDTKNPEQIDENYTKRYPAEWTVVRTPEAFRRAVSKHSYHYYSLDYNLGKLSSNQTGMDLLIFLDGYLRDNPPKAIPAIIIHAPYDKNSRQMLLYSREMMIRFREEAQSKSMS